MQQSFEKEGIKFLDFSIIIMIKSLRLAWISRILSDTEDTWKAIQNYFLSDYRGLSFLLRCNYKVHLINKSLPVF